MKKGLKRIILLLLPLMVATWIVTPLSYANAASVSGEKDIQILGTSDLHGRFDSFDYASNTANTAGGLTQISQKVKELRAQNPDTLLVDAGDTIQDNMADLFLNDPVHPMFVAMNAMKYDTWTLGNHEFNYGASTIERIVKEPKADVLCGNIYKADGTRLGKPYAIKTVDGVRVAIIGMTTPNILVWDGTKLPGYKATSPIDETKAAISEIKKANSADVIIAVVHMGLDKEMRDDDNARALAEACPELSAIVCGHYHVVINGQKVNQTIITEPGKFGENLSKLDIKVQPKVSGGYEVTDVASTVLSMKNLPIDTGLNKQLQPFHDRAVSYSNQVIGKLQGGDLVPPDTVPGVTQGQIQDSALMHLILDTQTYYTKPYVPENAHLVSSAALFDPSANIKAGDIKRCSMVKIYKFDNTLYTLKITGKELKKYMEWSASYYNQTHAGDLTVSFNPQMPSYLYDVFSGVNYEINIAQPAGSRVENLKYTDGTPVNDTDTIYLSSNDYRTSSTLLGNLFKDDNVTVVHKTANDKIGAVRDMLSAYISKVKNGVINNKFTPNWKITGFSADPKQQALAAAMVRDGVLKIPHVENGKNFNAKSITYDDIKPYLALYNFTSDTNGAFTVKNGSTYQFKITANRKPSFACGSPSFKLVSTKNVGSTYYYKVSAVGYADDKCGFYVNGNRVAVGKIVSQPFTSDTNGYFNVKSGNTYQFKITAPSKPSFACGSKYFKEVSTVRKGNVSYITVTAAGTAGTKTGFYVNGKRFAIAAIKK